MMAQPSSWPNKDITISNHRIPETSFTTGRRQYRSCDQCRKGKRACDIAILNEHVHSTSSPCSNCAKTGKLCSAEWLRCKDGLLPRRQKQTSGAKTFAKRTVNDLTDWNAPDLDGYGTFQRHASPLRPGSDNPLYPSSYSFEQNFGGRLQHQSSYAGPSSDAGQPLASNGQEFETHNVIFYDFNDAVPVQPARVDGCVRTTADNVSGRFETALENDPTQTKQRNQRAQRRNLRRPAMTATFPSTTRTKPASRVSERIPPLFHASSPSLADPSSASLEYRLASSASKSFISGSLMKIYHDSMENALSCWLTERTCPYDVEVSSRTDLGSSASDSIGQECDSVWSNRICERVCRLDKVCDRLRGRPLTRSEDEAVERTLGKTIMAFATQWAHSSARSTAEFPDMGSRDLPFLNPRSLESASVEFDRSMQEMFWYQARQALRDTAGITSFRVVFAHIIFSLTQKPLDVAQGLQKLRSGNLDSGHSFENGPSEFNDMRNDSPLGRSTMQPIFLSPNLALGGETEENGSQASASASDSTSASASASLDQILELEGPPIFLETALRQMFSFRCKLEKLDSQRWINIKKSQNSTLNVRETRATSQTSDTLLNAPDRHTFNLLFWLAIMFDTLSAAMNKRPLVVSDEDSDILEDRNLAVDESNPDFEWNGFQGSNTTTTGRDYRDPTGSGSRLWGEFFLHRSNLQQRQNIVRWPCSYVTAAATLRDAAPVKVLLFRRVTRLQTIISRRTRPEKLENAIRDALVIHDYWDSKYAPFIRDCVSHHETLPPRIQSWYVILAGHWHLGGLLLADIIEGIDETESGLSTHRTLRITTKLVHELRIHNAFAISDLGRCSSPHPDSSFPQSREFHSAVNKGALLTEPWTEVLIRSFSKACSVFLDMFPRATEQQTHEHIHAEALKEHCESCIQALWYLGKKSDMALLASNVLSNSLRDKIKCLPSNFDDRSQSIPSCGELEVESTISNISEFCGWNVDDSFPLNFLDESLLDSLNYNTRGSFA